MPDSQENHVYIGTATEKIAEAFYAKVEEDVGQIIVSVNMGKRTRSVMEFVCCAVAVNQTHI